MKKRNNLIRSGFLALALAAAALLLIKPTTFIDPVSWIIFGVVAMLTIMPSVMENLKIRKAVEFLSHPILLIVLAGIAGYAIYS